MNGLRTRLDLTHDRAYQQALNESVRVGDSVVGWICCIGLVLFLIYELSGRYL